MCLLKVNPAHRLTASELTDHPWITGVKSEHTGPTNVLEMMKQWKDELRLEENGQVDGNANVQKSEDSVDGVESTESVKEGDDDNSIKEKVSLLSMLWGNCCSRTYTCYIPDLLVQVVVSHYTGDQQGPTYIYFRARPCWL